MGGCVIGLAGAVRVLVSVQPESVSAASFMPGGAIHLQIDTLAAFFLLPVFGLSILTAIYGGSYMSSHGERRGTAASWFHLNLLTAGMAAVVAAHDGLLFLLAWEIMALSPFFLVIFDDRQEGVRQPISGRRFFWCFSCCSAASRAAPISTLTASPSTPTRPCALSCLFWR